MTTRLGVGYYPKTDENHDPPIAVEQNPGAVLCVVTSQRGAHAVARAVRDQRPDANRILRVIPDWCAANDNLQYDESEPAVKVAQRWEYAILWEWGRYPGLYDAVVGINERLPGGGDSNRRARMVARAAIETELADRFQKRGICYAFGSFNAGGLEAADVDLFADLFASFPVCYHAYLPPDKTSIKGEDGFYVLRPFTVWSPVLWQAKRTMRGLFAGEVGTFRPWSDMGLGAGDAARICQEINAELAGVCHAQSVPYHGACAYGLGLEGAEAKWNLTDARAELKGTGRAPAPFKIGAPPPPVVTPPAPIPIPPPGGTMPTLKTITLGGVEVFDVRDRFPFEFGRSYAERPLAQIDLYVQHHYGVVGLATATSIDEALRQLDAAHRWHTGLTPGGHDWPSIGYSFGQDGVGRLYYLNNINLVTYHARAANETAIGVLWLGTFDGTSPPAAMVESSRRLKLGLERHLGRPLKLLAHFEAPTNQTDCPGRQHWAATRAAILRPDTELLEQQLWAPAWVLKERASVLGRHELSKAIEVAVVADKVRAGAQQVNRCEPTLCD